MTIRHGGLTWMAVIGVVILVAGGAIVLHLSFRHSAVSSGPRAGSSGPPVGPGYGPKSVARTCGRPVLRSPFDYHGKAGGYSSGTAGLPTYGNEGSDFPADTRGIVLPSQTKDYQNWQLEPKTVYYLEPGTHIGSFAANAKDAFVGGYWRGGGTILSGDYGHRAWAIDSNSSDGDQRGVTIEYLTIEKYQPPVDAAAVDQDGNTSWTIRYDTIMLNVPGGGVFASSNSILEHNCLTMNGQYGFQSAVSELRDSLTTGPYNITVDGNEISYNDTCDLSGLLDNEVIGWHNHNPVLPKYRNRQCGKVVGDGNQGGFKLWQTNGVTIKDNYIHNNWGPGGWADTDNANTTWIGNSIIDNENAGIIEEISYNFSITDNYLAGNDWTDGLANAGFPQPAIYISESGSSMLFGGVPGCREKSCENLPSYRNKSVIAWNKLVNNGGNIFLWQNSNRSCDDGSDHTCTLLHGGHSGPFKLSSCGANLPSASINTTTLTGNQTGSSREDWWDGCHWETANVSVTDNEIEFNPKDIPHCNNAAWRDCGAGGIFSEYGAPAKAPGWAIATQLTFFQHDVWSDNTYIGPSTFYAWNQGNPSNPVSWDSWTGNLNRGDRCTSASERQSGNCVGPFGQDAGSTYQGEPAA